MQRDWWDPLEIFSPKSTIVSWINDGWVIDIWLNLEYLLYLVSVFYCCIRMLQKRPHACEKKYNIYIKSMKKKQTSIKSLTIRLDTDPIDRIIHCQDKGASQEFQPETTSDSRKSSAKTSSLKGKLIYQPLVWGRTQQQWKGQARCAEQGLQQPSSHRQGTKQFPSVGVAKLSRYQERRCHQIHENETRIPDVSIIAA